MPNNTATIRGYVQNALRDTTAATWTTAVIDEVVGRVIASLWPRLQRPLDSESFTQTLTTSDYYYALSASITALSRVDWVDGNSQERGVLPGHLWEIHGSLIQGTAKIHVSPSIVDGPGGTLRYLGYGRFDGTTNFIPDEYLPYVISECVNYLAAYELNARTQFKQYGVADQRQNVSTTELVSIMAEHRQRADRERARQMTWRKPMQARIG